MDPVKLGAILEVARPRTVIKNLTGSSAVLVALEWLACLPDEIEYIWPSDWTLVKVLYLICRYSTLLNVSAATFFNNAPSASPKMCRDWFSLASVISSIGISAAQALLYIRVHALTGRKRIFAVSLSIIYAGLIGGGFATVIAFLYSLQYAPSPISSVVSCWAIAGDNHMLSNGYICVLTSEIVILAITLYTCITSFKGSRSRLVALFYRDGIGFFWILALISTGNIICHFVAPHGYAHLLSTMQALLHAFLATRMVLHLKKAFTGDALSTDASSLSLANLGAPLDFRHNDRRENDIFVVSVRVETTQCTKEPDQSYVG